MARKPLAGHELRQLTRCPECGGRLRNPRSSKRCPRCRQVKDRSEWPHARSRSDHMDSECTACKRARDRRSVHDIGKPRPKGTAHEPSVLGPLGEYTPVWVRADVVTGTVESSEWVYGWVMVRDAFDPILAPMQNDDGDRIYEITLRDAYYDDGEGPERSLYLGSDGRVTFLTDHGTYVVGEPVTVTFDTEGLVTEIKEGVSA